MGWIQSSEIGWFLSSAQFFRRFFNNCENFANVNHSTAETTERSDFPEKRFTLPVRYAAGPEAVTSKPPKVLRRLFDRRSRVDFRPASGLNTGVIRRLSLNFRRLPAAVAPALCVVFLAACRPAPAPETEPEAPFIDIGDGSKVTARGALRSAGEMATDHGVTIFFTREESGPKFISVLPRETSICAMGVRLTGEAVLIGDEIQTLEERLKRFREYALGGRMTGSTPVLLVDAHTGVPGTELVEIFHELLESEIDTIIAPYHFEPE